MHHKIHYGIQSVIRYRFQAMEHQCVKLTHQLENITELPPRPRTMSQWRWWVGASAWAISEKLLYSCWCVTWKRQFPSKLYCHYIRHSHHHYHSLIQSSSRQPTIYFPLLVDFIFHLSSCKLFAFIRFFSTGNHSCYMHESKVGVAKSYSPKFTSRIRPLFIASISNRQVHPGNCYKPWLFYHGCNRDVR